MTRELVRQSDEEVGPCRRCGHSRTMHYEVLEASSSEMAELAAELTACVHNENTDGLPQGFVVDETYIPPPEVRERMKFLKENTLNLGDFL